MSEHEAAGYVLRDYQVDAINRIREAFQAGATGVLAVAPTGAGKTVIFTEILRLAREKGRTGVVLAHRQELLQQASEKLSAYGIRHGIIKAKPSTDRFVMMQICSIDSMRNRELGFTPDIIVVDEAHLASADRYKNFLARYPKSLILGFTATPFRADGKGFKHFAQQIVVISTISKLIQEGHLVRPRYFVGQSPIGLDDVKTASNGDFDQVQLENLVNTTLLVGDIIENFKTNVPAGTKAVCFCVGIKHSVNVTQNFIKAGIKAEHLDGEMPAKERKAILGRLKSGETQVVCNANVLCEGWDEPSIGAVILARPTKSLALYIQQGGRGLRTFPGKEECIVLDHGENYDRHGCLTITREYSLEPKKKKKSKKTEKDENTYCPGCFKMTYTKTGCEGCGFVKEPNSRDVVEMRANIKEIKVSDLEMGVREEYARLLTVARQSKKQNGKPYHRSWAWWKLEEKLGAELVLSILPVSERPYKYRELGR